MNIKKINLGINSVYAYCFLLPVYIFLINFNKVEYHLNIFLLTYPVILYMYFCKMEQSRRFFVLLSLSMFILAIYGIYNIVIFNGGYSLDYLLSVIKFFVYMLPLIIIVLRLRHSHPFNFALLDANYRLMILSVFAIYFSLIIYNLFGFFILADAGYGHYRPSAFFSEPSAAACFILPLVVYSLFKVNLKLFLFSFFAFISTQSLVGFVTFFIVLVLVYALRFRLLLRVIFILVLISLSVLFIWAVLSYENLGYDFLDIPMKRLKTGFEAIVYFNIGAGYNPRLTNTVELLEYLFQSSWYLTGFGFFSDTYLPVSDNFGSATSFLTFVLFNFGIFALAIYLTFAIYVYFSLPRTISLVSVCFVSFTVYGAFNSAQGIFFYHLVLLYLYLGWNRFVYNK